MLPLMWTRKCLFLTNKHCFLALGRITSGGKVDSVGHCGFFDLHLWIISPHPTPYHRHSLNPLPKIVVTNLVSTVEFLPSDHNRICLPQLLPPPIPSLLHLLWPGIHFNQATFSAALAPRLFLLLVPTFLRLLRCQLQVSPLFHSNFPSFPVSCLPPTPTTGSISPFAIFIYALWMLLKNQNFLTTNSSSPPPLSSAPIQGLLSISSVVSKSWGHQHQPSMPCSQALSNLPLCSITKSTVSIQNLPLFPSSCTPSVISTFSSFYIHPVVLSTFPNAVLPCPIDIQASQPGAAPHCVCQHQPPDRRCSALVLLHFRYNCSDCGDTNPEPFPHNTVENNGDPLICGNRHFHGRLLLWLFSFHHFKKSATASLSLSHMDRICWNNYSIQCLLIFL